MDAKDVAKKYGVWILGGALVLYLVYRNMRGGSRPLIGSAPPGAAGMSGEQYRLESERLKQAGALDLERLRLNAAEEAARRRADLDRYNLEQQAAARNRALSAQERGQTLGLIGQIAKGISDLFRGQQSQSRGGSSGGSTPGTPPIFGGRTQPQTAPYYQIPVPSIGVFNDPSYVPAYPEPSPEYMQLRIDDWGEAPQFQTSGLDLDSGATFTDQSYYGSGGDDFYYGYGQGFSSGDIYSSEPELGPDYGFGYDPEGYSEEFYGFDWGGGGYDFVAPVGVDEGGYSEEFYGFDFED
jgi:hypothetical protein